MLNSNFEKSYYMTKHAFVAELLSAAQPMLETAGNALGSIGSSVAGAVKAQPFLGSMALTLPGSLYLQRKGIQNANIQNKMLKNQALKQGLHI